MTTDDLLRTLTAERDAAISVETHEPVKFRATLELVVPPDVPAAAYQAALVDALQAFSDRNIAARVFRVEFAPTRTLPHVSAESSR